MATGVKLNPPLRWRQTAGQAVEEGRLTRATFTDNAQHFTGTHLERDIVAAGDHSIMFGQATDAQQRLIGLIDRFLMGCHGHWPASLSISTSS